MSPWVSRIALIAYLCGGWILPATHDHGVSVCAAAAPSACCHHHDCQAPTDTTDPQVVGIEIDHCGGACVLCMARTLVVAGKAHDQNRGGLPASEHSRFTQPPFFSQATYCPISARGPPKGV